MKHLKTLVLLTCLLVTSVAQAQMVQMPIPPHTADVWAPEVASSPNGCSMMVYGASGDPLLQDFVMVMRFESFVTDNLVWPWDPITLTAGSSAKVCWSRNGFYVAVISSPVVLLYHFDLEGIWDQEEIILTPGGEVTGLDLWGVPTEAAGPDVFLAIETWNNPPYGQHGVQFASHSAYGWSPLETVITEMEFRPYPQITWSLGPAGPWPTIFYLDGESWESNLLYTTKDLAAGWSVPVTVPGDGVSAPNPIAREFDVVTFGGLQRNVLGLGEQPLCPCGHIFHQSHENSQWSVSETVTQGYEDMDWPFSPRLAVDSAGRVHAFWYQLASSPTLDPLRKTLEYHVLNNGVWSNEGAFLNSSSHGENYGERVAIDVGMNGFPVLAYTRRDTVDGEPQPETIWVARRFYSSDAPDSPLPQKELNLTAWPNPFNPQITIAFETEAAQEARLEVFDTRGRRVALLLDRVVDAGHIKTVWNGRGVSGSPLPSGVYYARLEAGEFRAVKKLVLAK